MSHDEKQPRLSKLYQLYDTAAECIAGPIIPHSKEGAAVRAFNELLQNSDALPGKYPQDFALIWVGTQNEETGRIHALDFPQTVYTGKQYLQAAAAARDATANTTRALQEEADETPELRRQ